jgi:hypothetical protein
LAYFNGTLLYEPKHQQASWCLKTDHPLKIAGGPILTDA